MHDARVLVQCLDRRQEALSLQAFLVEVVRACVRCGNQGHATPEQPFQQPAQDHRIADVADEEFVETQHRRFPGDGFGDLVERILDVVHSLQSRVHIAHQAVEMAAAFLPDWLGRYEEYFDSSKDLLGISEGADGAKQQFEGAGDVLSDAKAFYGDVGEGDAAVDLLRSGTGRYDPSSDEYGVDKFMSGYDDAVLAQVEKDIERQGDVSRKRANDKAIAAGAFGGSRQGLQAAEVERNIQDAKANASAKLRQQAYDNALKASQTAYESGQTRGLEAGRLMGGLGQSYGGIGTAMGGLGGQMTGAAGTAADVGRVKAGLSPADLDYMTKVGMMDRDYRQDVIDTERLEEMRGTEQAMLPINYGMSILSGNPAANLTSTYGNTYAQQPGVADAMVGGLGAYTTMQGINRA